MTKLFGRAMPRIYTKPLDPDENGLPKRSLGPQLMEYARAIGVEPMPWQRNLFYLSTELLPDGTFRFKTVIVEVARQNGKSTYLTVRSGYMAIVEGGKVVSTAQDLSTAVDLWKAGLKEIANSPLSAYLLKVRHASGQQEAEFDNGATWKVAATTASAGRGKQKIRLLTMDEARELSNFEGWDALTPTQGAAPNPQLILASNAGDRKSIVLQSQRAAALASMDDPDTEIALYSWSAPDGCRVDDEQAWAMANPALGHTLSLSFLRTKSKGPENTFRTEHLCQWVTTEMVAIPTAAWASCGSKTAVIDPTQPQFWAIDVSLSGQSVSLVGAQYDKTSDRVTVQVLKRWEGAEAAAQAGREMATLVVKHKPKALAWQSSAAATVLSVRLRELRGKTALREIRGTDVASVCTRFVDRVQSLRAAHSFESILDRQVETAEAKPRGELIVFTSGKGGPALDTLYATALASDLAAKTRASTMTFITSDQESK